MEETFVIKLKLGQKMSAHLRGVTVTNTCERGLIPHDGPVERLTA